MIGTDHFSHSSVFFFVGHNQLSFFVFAVVVVVVVVVLVVVPENLLVFCFFFVVLACCRSYLGVTTTIINVECPGGQLHGEDHLRSSVIQFVSSVVIELADQVAIDK